MTQKTYRKYKYNTSIAMTIKGIKRAINFKSIGKNMYDFVTTEKDVQDALEKSFEFKKTFYLVDTKELQSEEVKAPIVVNDVADEDKELIIDPIVDIPIDIDNNDKDLPISNLGEVAGTPTEVPIKPKEAKPKQPKKPVYKKPKTKK